jgi:hypothetical protein
MAIVPAVLAAAAAFVPQANAQSVYLSTRQEVAPRVQATPIQLPNGTVGSANWSGYVVTPSSSSYKYTSVTGSWKVPQISGISTSVGAQWIGLGGVTSNDLLQMGTIEQIREHREVATLFWEKLPDSAQNFATVPVGSSIKASISHQSGSTWSLDFHIVEPNGKTLQKHISVHLTSDYADGIGTSAEWISEDPSTPDGELYPLADTGVVKFTDARANGEPITSPMNRVQPMALINQWGKVRIVPTALDSGGTSFSTLSVGRHALSRWSSYWWEQFLNQTVQGW